MTKTLDAFLQHLDDQTAAAIRPNASRTNRAGGAIQSLKATLLAAHTGDDEVADSLKSMLDGFRSGHITSLDIVSETARIDSNHLLPNVRHVEIADMTHDNCYGRDACTSCAFADQRSVIDSGWDSRFAEIVPYTLPSAGTEYRLVNCHAIRQIN